MYKRKALVFLASAKPKYRGLSPYLLANIPPSRRRAQISCNTKGTRVGAFCVCFRDEAT